MQRLEDAISTLVMLLADLSTADRIEAINAARIAIHDVSPFKTEPVDLVLWVKNDSVYSNDYNPNSVAPPEMELLRLSIKADGYTQPIVSMADDDGRREHYKNKIAVYLKWWMSRGYPDGIPDEADLKIENAGKAPSWRRVCKTLLRNDYWCKYLGFSPTKTSAYAKYTDLMARRREKWNIFSDAKAAS